VEVSEAEDLMGVVEEVMGVDVNPRFNLVVMYNSVSTFGLQRSAMSYIQL